MAVFADGKIEAYVGPQELGGADNLEQVIVDFIAGARRSLDIAVQAVLNVPRTWNPRWMDRAEAGT